MRIERFRDIIEYSIKIENIWKKKYLISIEMSEWI